MSQLAIPKFLLPRGRQYLRSAQAARILHSDSNTTVLERHASTSSKPRVLEKPAKFNPPSHPSRLRTKPKAYPGPPLSEKQKQEQKTKQYPHMMPPEGTFLNWFLREKSIHVWISMGVLFSLAFYVFITDFTDKTALKHLLPTREDWRLHPVHSFRQFWSVYRLHVEQTSAETAERRRRQTEDVQKRKEYRIAHGLEERRLPFGLGVATPEEQARRTAQGVVEESPTAPSQSTTEEGESSYVDFEGRKRPVKKWLGIW